MQISVYSTKICAKCKMLKKILEKENIQYKDINMATPAALTELRMNNVFTMSAPVLQIDNKFYTTTELCVLDIIDQNKVKELLLAN